MKKCHKGEAIFKENDQLLWEKGQRLERQTNYQKAYSAYQFLIVNNAFHLDYRIAAQRQILWMYANEEVAIPYIPDTVYLLKCARNFNEYISIDVIDFPDYSHELISALNLDLYLSKPDLFQYSLDIDFEYMYSVMTMMTMAPSKEKTALLKTIQRISVKLDNIYCALQSK